MYCTKCGSENPDDAIYCYRCGSKHFLPTEIPPGPVAPSRPAATKSSPAGKKSAGLAAILNFFFGLGYAYLGYNRVLGVPTVVFIILALIVFFLLGVVTVGIVTAILAILLAVDGYKKGRGQLGFISAE